MLRRRDVGPAALASALAVSGATWNARAAAPWVDRPITLPRSDWAFNFGLGIGHVGPREGEGLTGVGVNFDGAVGLTDRLQLGLRGGTRFGLEARAVSADEYGRLFDRQTFATGGDTFANPEVSLRGALLSREVLELALEGRVVLPFEEGTRFAAMFAVPMALHFGNAARLDTGLYVPIVFQHDPRTAIAIPAQLYFQATNRFWLGPLSGVRIVNPGGHTQVPLGLGLGYSVTPTFDLKSALYFRDVSSSDSTRAWGVGMGVEVRVE